MVERRRRVAVDTRDIRRAEQEIHRVNRQLDRMNSVGRGGGLRLGGLRTMVLSAGILAAGTSVMNTGLQAQADRASFQTLAGEQQGARLFNDLTRFAQESIFGNEVHRVAQTMKAFGVETEKIMPNLKMLGDISMGNKDRLQSLSLAYSQIQSTGKLMGQDLLQLINAGFNPLTIISEKTGVSMAELKERMAQGAISAKAVEMAFQAATGPGGQFYKMIERILNSDFGKLQKLRGQIEGLAMLVGGMLAPALGELITHFLSPMVEKMRDLARWAYENRSGVKAFASAAIAFVTIAKGWTIVQAALNVQLWAMAAALAANPVTWIALAIAALIGVVVYAYLTFDKWKKYVYATAEVLRDFGKLIKEVVITHITSLLSGITGVGRALYLLFTGEFKEAISAGKAAFLDLTGANTARVAYNGARNLGQSWANGLAKGINDEKGKVSAAMVIGPGRPQLSATQASLLGGAVPAGFTVAKSVIDKKESADLLKEISGGKKKGRTSAMSSSVTSGGPRTITINLNREMIGQLAINSFNVREGVRDMEAMVEESLRRILVSASASS